MREDESITLKDIRLTQYELIGGNARWYWDPRYIPPGKEEDAPLDETILKDIDRALDTRIYHRKKQYRKRWRNIC
jgi:hypothetical protein